MKRVFSPEGTLTHSDGGERKDPTRGCHMRNICLVSGWGYKHHFQAVCSLYDPHMPKNLVENAGSRWIDIRSDVKVARHPSLVKLLPAYFSIFPVAA